MVNIYNFEFWLKIKRPENVLYVFVEFHNVIRCAILRHAQEKIQKVRLYGKTAYEVIVIKKFYEKLT